MNPNAKREWHCLRTHTKREHIAAAILSHIQGVDVFCPRISQIRKTRSGKKRFVEAMFPGYLLARFCYREHYRRIIHSQGISCMVQLGERRVIPNRVIEELKASIPQGIVEAPDPSLRAGAEIKIVSGSLKGLNGTVLAQLPRTERLQILLELLGREITVTVNPDDVLLSSDGD